MTRSQPEFESVKRLIGEGHNDCEVSRLTGVPRPTVRDWRRGLGDAAIRWPSNGHRPCSGEHDMSTLPSKEYSYLLGMYLGDGYIAAHPRNVYCLRIFTDARVRSRGLGRARETSRSTARWPLPGSMSSSVLNADEVETQAWLRTFVSIM